ncbi:hypothetical protein QN277_006180 [Acacia crassicarpa]|uniref:F-box domain-containing protein n=1 Tax=Acacia crassicarpa TaxID=499986 RepID=A0AAE1IZV5_9FABA|nr:hypothetical protein QN277_006180 [Acacia crassicarpa]
MKRLKTNDGHTPYIPEGIMGDILKRLPVKSLVRFQSVSKRWKNLFQTSSFIANHHRHHSHQNSFLLLECYGEWNPCEKCNPMHLCFVDRELRISKVHNEPRISFNGEVRVVNSSYGLLCVGLHGRGDRGRSNFLVYNVATREVRKVRKPLIDKLYPEGYCFGFGFCPILNDYKIVRVRVSGYHFHETFDGAEVFSGSTGSWKIFKDKNLENVFLFKVQSFTCNRAIFWFGSKRVVKGEYVSLIVSFDIAMEVFSLIPMPPIDFNYKTANFTLHESKLGVLHGIESPESCRIELWVMEEDKSAAGEREIWSWTKKYTSNPYPFLLLPRAIWRNEIVCTIIDETPRRGSNNIVLINLTTNEFNKVSTPRFDPSHGIFNYVQSIVSVTNIDSKGCFLQ